MLCGFVYKGNFERQATHLVTRITLQDMDFVVIAYVGTRAQSSVLGLGPCPRT